MGVLAIAVAAIIFYLFINVKKTGEKGSEAPTKITTKPKINVF